MTAQPVSLGWPPAETVFLDRLARLCRARQGAGPAMALPVGTGTDRERKTCIDGGRDMMVTCHVAVSGACTVSAAVAHTDLPGPNARRWSRWALGAAVTPSESLIFGQPAPGDWELARTLVPGHETIGARLSALLTRGTVYLATRDEPGTGRHWVSFALTRTAPPRETLAALGLPQIWSPLKSAVSDLLGRPISERTRPWSVALSPAGDGLPASIRLGTTLWARQPEDSSKLRRFGSQIDALGGPGAQMAGIYDFICRQSPAPRGVGVAAEFDFDIEEQSLTGAHYTFRVPALSRELERQNG